MVEIGTNTIEIGFLEGQIVNKNRKIFAPLSPPLGNYLKNTHFSSNSGHFHPISSSVGRREGLFFSSLDSNIFSESMNTTILKFDIKIEVTE